jgi:TfoX/Sxy family transcriptional regulator of competence genes
MASDKKFVDFVMDQLSDVQRLASKKMFGEIAIYCDVKLVALICDNQLFVKVSEAGREHIGIPTLAAPYPGAKPCFLIQDKLDDKLWLSMLIQLTADTLPVPKLKTSKKSSRGVA